MRINRASGAPEKTTQPPSGNTAEVSPQAQEAATTAPLGRAGFVFVLIQIYFTLF